MRRVQKAFKKYACKYSLSLSKFLFQIKMRAANNNKMVTRISDLSISIDLPLGRVFS
jgi:hypothetical protein